MTTVEIGGRTFRVGATYAPKKGSVWRGPAVFEGMSKSGLFVLYTPVGGLRTDCNTGFWLEQAGDEVQPR